MHRSFSTPTCHEWFQGGLHLIVGPSLHHLRYADESACFTLLVWGIDPLYLLIWGENSQRSCLYGGSIVQGRLLPVQCVAVSRQKIKIDNEIVEVGDGTRENEDPNPSFSLSSSLSLPLFSLPISLPLFSLSPSLSSVYLPPLFSLCPLTLYVCLSVSSLSPCLCFYLCLSPSHFLSSSLFVSVCLCLCQSVCLSIFPGSLQDHIELVYLDSDRDWVQKFHPHALWLESRKVQLGWHNRDPWSTVPERPSVRHRTQEPHPQAQGC